jgi:hypothetical protein
MKNDFIQRSCRQGVPNPKQGCQMVCFQTKNPNLGKFWRVLEWKILVYFRTIWSILRQLEIFYGRLVYFVVAWYIFPRFGILYQEKSGNPDPKYICIGGGCYMYVYTKVRSLTSKLASSAFVTKSKLLHTCMYLPMYVHILRKVGYIRANL